MNITVSPAVAPHVTLGIVAFDQMTVTEGAASLDGPLAESAERLRAGADLADRLSAVRAMYHRFGVDPTKTRPSSEALLRRVRKAQPLPRVNSAVDVCNWCSAETQLPFGLYDMDRLDGDVELRVGAEGESYDGIRKDRVNLAGRLTLADAHGPFGNPTSDSARSMVTPATRRVLLAVFGPRSLGPAAVVHALDLTSQRMQAHCGARETMRAVV